MNISTSTLHGRGAASPVASPLRAAFKSVWQGMQRFGQRRAARHLDMLALQYRVSDPVLAQQMRQAAAECRSGGAGAQS